jgi:hypothetical protein
MARDGRVARTRERSEAAGLRKLNEVARVLRRTPASHWLHERLEEMLPTVVRGLKEIAECEDDRAAAQARALLRKYGPDLKRSLREREECLRLAGTPSGHLAYSNLSAAAPRCHLARV